jgi:uncharacterized protein
MIHLSFAGHDLAISPEGLLWWPSRRALMVADLHLEKASFFARWGQMLPPYDSAATLQALAVAVDALQPAEVWCLGDSFHDRLGCTRLPGDEQAKLRSLTAGCDWIWISGNHDAGSAMAEHCGGRAIEMAEIDGILLRHEADPGERRPEISGHFHPKLRLTLRGRRVARRCYVATADKLILPAFGALTGGMDADDPVILAAIGRPGEALIPVANRLLRFPLAA